MGIDDKYIDIQICRECRHFEREKTVEENGARRKMVMCKYYLDEGKEPFTIGWAEMAADGDRLFVHCLKNL